MDDEVKGAGNHVSFGNYGYDSRLGRRFNVDPMTAIAPSWSPYRTFFDNPITWTDPTVMTEDWYQNENGDVGTNVTNDEVR